MTVVLRVGGGVEGLDTLTDELADWDTVSRAVGSAPGEARTIVARRAEQLALELARTTGGEVHVVHDDDVRVVRPPEPTPWGTGLVLSALAAAVVLIAVLAFTRPLQQFSGVLALAANVVVVGGVAPSLWLVRRRPVWRWAAAGAAAGVLLAWVWLLLTALGR